MGLMSDSNNIQTINQKRKRSDDELRSKGRPIKYMKRLWNRRGSLVHSFLRGFEPVNPTFTEEDRAMKLSICKVQSEKECFVTHRTKGVGIGDHLFEIKGYFKSTGQYGLSKSEWNILPVCGAFNPSYKKVRLRDGTTKDLGKDFLTSAEAQLLKPEDQRIYGIIRRWIAYSKSRGAVLSYRLTPEQEAYIDSRMKKYRSIIEQEECRFEEFLKKEKKMII